MKWLENWLDSIRRTGQIESEYRRIHIVTRRLDVFLNALRNRMEAPDGHAPWAEPHQRSAFERSRGLASARYVAGLGLGLALLLASFTADAQESTTTTAAQTTTESTTTSTTTESSSTTAAAQSTSTTAPATTAPPTTTPSTTAAGATSSTEAPTTVPEGATNTSTQAEKNRALANLSLARAADEEVARSLNAINSSANATLEKIDRAQQQLEIAQITESRTGEALAATNERQDEIESALRRQAVEGFRSQRVDGRVALLSSASLGDAVRQEQMLSQANASTGDLLEELRVLNEDRRLANAEAANAKAEAEEAQRILTEEFEVLESQRRSQLGLKAEAERRIDQWAGELNNYAKSDQAVQAVIANSSNKADVTIGINSVGSTSVSGFQWPVTGKATSEFGYRVHPVYGTRRLHAGLDVGAPNGTDIWAAADGVVIFSGVQGGYGRTVIIDHGGGITTLYAHQSTILVPKDAVVKRGTAIGKVGSTGTSTGNHLHFEVRVNGQPTNPRDHLPAG